MIGIEDKLRRSGLKIGPPLGYNIQNKATKHWVFDCRLIAVRLRNFGNYTQRCLIIWFGRVPPFARLLMW
jgi:hypothetical protein